MPPFTNFFNHPPFARINRHIDTEKEPTHEIRETLEPSAHSPTLKRPAPIFIDLTLDSCDSRDVSKFEACPVQSPSGQYRHVPPSRTDQNSQNNESALPSSSQNENFLTSQRIVKGGKEVVISSDGEETDSVSSLEDPDILFVQKGKEPQNNAPKVHRAIQPNEALLAQLSAPKSYKNSIDSLVHDAVDDNEIEANVAKARALFATPTSSESNLGNGQVKTKKGLHESLLTSAMGNDDEKDESALRRLLDAVRRTDALDRDHVWRFFDPTAPIPAVLEFPTHLVEPGSGLSGLLEPESRMRLFQSGILEFAAFFQDTPDEFIRWLFHSIPLEPRDELRQAYRRIFTRLSAERVGSLIRPNDIDDLFLQLGARQDALDPSKIIVQDSLEEFGQDSQLEDVTDILPVLDLLRDSAELLSNNAREHAVYILLRMTLDTSLTADAVILSDLQGALCALLESVPYSHVQATEYRICLTLYETVKDVQFQSRILQHILPTSTWISRLRYRLATAFLLQIPSPLTEPPEKVLDLKRLTIFLIRDERFHLKTFKGRPDYDYGELTAISMLLDVVINSSLYDLGLMQGSTETEFNAAIDKLAVQIKRIFCSIEDAGASHLKRMLAKEALEALHYRVVYSVRSRPPPKKTLFQAFARENGDIKAMFNTKIAIDRTAHSANNIVNTARPA